MILVRLLRLGIAEPEEVLRTRLAKELRLSENDISDFHITKKSLDARKKSDIHYTCAAAVSVHGDERTVLARARSKNAELYTEPCYEIPSVKVPRLRPVIVGFGPAGMFAALVLAKAGACPIVIERGADAETRREKVESFRAGGKLDSECNVQFGEGGAGTFSDGKLGTGIRNERISWILGQFRLHGAPESITYDSKPHIGTDILINVVQSMRREIISLGGEIRFNTRLTGLVTEGGELRAIETSGGLIPCERLILAIGHSARDTFEMLLSSGVPMEPKPFSMGVRIEHRQSEINRAQYGELGDRLPAADYSLAVHLPDGTSAYTFCMCPGGEVIAAASEEGGVVTNGMSLSRRDGENANSALLVTLHPEDFPYEGALGGMLWQREIERRAYALGNDYLAPAQLAGDFLGHTASTGARSVKPTYRPGVHWCELHDVLPPRITEVLENALPELGKRLAGFDCPDAVLTAPETRSSSPVRIIRDENRMSPIVGLYPCGEGAGYAGGITSAAVDGMRVAETVLREYI